MSTWNSAYELVPAQADAPSTLGTTGRATRSDIRERMENEHSSYTTKGGTSGGSVAADFLHKQGSGRGYYATSAPTLRPDGVTALGTSDAGRMWFDDSGYRTYVWNGTAWVSWSYPYFGVYIQFPGLDTPATLFGGTWTNISSSFAGDFFRAEGGNASAFESGEQAGSIIHLTGSLAATPKSTNFPTRGAECDNYDSATTSTVAGTNAPYLSTPEMSIGTDLTHYVYVTRPVNRTVRIWKRTA